MINAQTKAAEKISAAFVNAVAPVTDRFRRLLIVR